MFCVCKLFHLTFSTEHRIYSWVHIYLHALFRFFVPGRSVGRSVDDVDIIFLYVPHRVLFVLVAFTAHTHTRARNVTVISMERSFSFLLPLAFFVFFSFFWRGSSLYCCAPLIFWWIWIMVMRVTWSRRRKEGKTTPKYSMLVLCISHKYYTLWHHRSGSRTF